MTKEQFTQFKKEIKKENHWFDTCAFYMTKRQEALHTATIGLVGNFAYERQIEYYRNSIEKVNRYDTWTQEEKERHEKYSLERIANYEKRLAEFSNPENEANHRIEQLKNTNAFKKLEALGVSVELVLMDNVYTARFHY